MNFCIARGRSGSWCRGIIEKLLSGAKAQVFFPDYGYRLKLAADDIRKTYGQSSLLSETIVLVKLVWGHTLTELLLCRWPVKFTEGGYQMSSARHPIS